MLTNKIKPAKYMLALLLIYAAILGLTSACGKNEQYEYEHGREYEYEYEVAQTNTTIGVHVTGGHMTRAQCLSTMVEFADIIVIGRYNGTYLTWNSRQDPRKMQGGGSSREYSNALLYDFIVDEVLLGEVSGHEITVFHRIAREHILVITNEVVSPAGVIMQSATDEREIAIEVDCLYFTEPIIGPTYILFLSRDDTLEQYGSWFQPFSIMVTPDGSVRLQTGSADAPSRFSVDIPHPFFDNTYIAFTADMGSGNFHDDISYRQFDDVVAQIRAYVDRQATTQLD